MLKKLLPIFLIAAIVAAQVVSRCAHAHAVAGGGTAVAHVHLGGHGNSEHDHGHSHFGHDHAGHCHHGNHYHDEHSDHQNRGDTQDCDDWQGCDGKSSNGQPLALIELAQSADHDANAVFMIDDDQSYIQVRIENSVLIDLAKADCRISIDKRPRCARWCESSPSQRPPKNPVYQLTRRILL